MSEKKDMLGNIVRGLVTIPIEKLGLLADLLEKLASKRGEEWFYALGHFLRKEDPWLFNNPYLRLIEGGVGVSLKATDGSRTISGATDVFLGRIDHDFKNWDLDESFGPTPKTKVSVLGLNQIGTFHRVFGGFKGSLDGLILTPHQVIQFCQDRPYLLGEGGHGNFFLLKRKKDGEFFVLFQSSD